MSHQRQKIISQLNIVSCKALKQKFSNQINQVVKLCAVMTIAQSFNAAFKSGGVPVQVQNWLLQRRCQIRLNKFCIIRKLESRNWNLSTGLTWLNGNASRLIQYTSSGQLMNLTVIDHQYDHDSILKDQIISWPDDVSWITRETLPFN